MEPARIGIVGGGLAGLAAAVALVESGLQVQLFEARRKLGGRAGSFVDPADGTTIDHCQHVAMGCCTNFLDFCRRTDIESLLDRHRQLHFFGPEGTYHPFAPSSWLPAPLHLAPALFRLGYLSFTEKLSIGLAMRRLMRSATADDKQRSIGEWLYQQRQSARAIERFWKVVLVSALGESLERASLAYARKVFRDGFWAHRQASDVLVPRVSLHELYDQRVGGWLRSRGTDVLLETPVETIETDGAVATGLRLSSGRTVSVNFVVVAVPWSRVEKLLPAELPRREQLARSLGNIAGAPITSVHLWFDQPITDLPHAVLVERLAQWVFARPGHASQPEHYYQVVISASHELIGRDRQDILDEVLKDLKTAFPTARHARLLRWRLVSEQNAVFSVQPGIDAFRPSQETAVPNLMLAGDWTQTGWPATMEGAVRSGYLAGEAILRRLGQTRQLVVPHLDGSS